MASKKKKGKDLDDVITSNLEANKGGECLIKHSIYFYHFVYYGTTLVYRVGRNIIITTYVVSIHEARCTLLVGCMAGKMGRGEIMRIILNHSVSSPDKP